ncbi:MAG TPA: tRNA preQ1(34) S-adenosylmethionine ribosyltransferase-isomerase QueA [Candidatus Paceibacterota bacterium]
MENFEKLLNRYDYQIPTAFIAQKPASPRDSAKLLIYPVRSPAKSFYLGKRWREADWRLRAGQDKSFSQTSNGVYERKTGATHFSTFAHIAEYLPKNSVLVFNETKVIPARLTVKKETGGKAEILYIRTVGATIEVMADRRLSVGSKLTLAPKIYLTVVGQKGKYYYLKSSFPLSRLMSVLEQYGQMPLPPYIKHTPLSRSDLKEKYQSVFARKAGSIAAPTASLHFTKRLLKKIEKSGIKVRFITLHVNLGTFAPLTEENVKTGRLHEEYYAINKKTADFLNRQKEKGAPIIAVGTTTVRALESAADKNTRLSKLSGATDLFIRESYQFKFADGVVTNFHVPKSSLLMLVASFTGREKLLKLYREAVKKKFKFFSFGDGMLVYPVRSPAMSFYSGNRWGGREADWRLRTGQDKSFSQTSNGVY